MTFLQNSGICIYMLKEGGGLQKKGLIIQKRDHTDVKSLYRKKNDYLKLIIY